MIFIFKNAVAYCLICSILLFFTACKNSFNEELNTDTINNLLTFLTPEDSEIISHIDNFIVLKSKQTVSELIIFYEDIFYKLELREYEINDEQDGIWIFSGVYHGIHNHIRGGGHDNETDKRERPFIVELRTDDESESIDVEIIY